MSPKVDPKHEELEALLRFARLDHAGIFWPIWLPYSYATEATTQALYRAAARATKNGWLEVEDPAQRLPQRSYRITDAGRAILRKIFKILQ
jgi:hypothetical protein